MSDKLYGRYRAKVENVDHPEGHYKVQVRLLFLWDDWPAEALPWAEPELALGTRKNNGAAIPLEVGDLVWVVFEAGDSRAPIITGGCLYAPEGVLNMPHEAFGGSESYQHKRTDKQPATEEPGYYENPVFSLYGTLFEAMRKGGFRLTHKASGSAVEVNKDGQFVLHGEAETFLSSKGDALVEGDGKLTIIVKGNADLESDGDISLKAKGKLALIGKGGVEMGGASFNWKKG